MKKINFFWKQEWTLLAGIVLGLRALYAAMGFWITYIGAASPLAESTYALIVPYLRSEPFFRYFINPWFQWDTLSYLEISILGYSASSSDVGYMPLYPLLMRAMSVFTLGDHLFAALLISTFFFWVALIFFYEILSELYRPATAWRGIIALLVFPSSFFFLAGYTESLFLCLVLSCWYSARHGRWYWAAALGGLATLTRLQGVVLTPMLLWMMLAQASAPPEKQAGKQVLQVWEYLRTSLKNKSFFTAPRLAWLAPFVPLLVFAGYQLWMRVAGYGTVFTALNTYWKIQTVLPWEGFMLFLQRLFTMRFIYSDWIDLFLFVIILGVSLVGLRLLDPSFSIYIWLTLAILFMRGTPPHLLASFSRYFLALFPVFILFALLRGRVVQLFAAIVSFALQLLLAWVFLIGSWVA